MVVFWSLAALMAALALAFVLVPLLRARSIGGPSAREAALDVLRGQRREIERDVAAGHLPADARDEALAELVERTGESANMAVLDNDMAVYVAQVPSPHAMRMFTEVGRRVHLHCTGVGKALLMQLPNESVHALLKRAGMPASNENSYTTPEALIRDIELSRSRGYAVDEGEQEIGVRCFAVPVPDAPTLTAISISGPAARLTLKSSTKVTPLLKRVARDIASEFDREAAV